MSEIFRKISHKVSVAMGSPYAFICATLVIIVWAICGHIFNYSDTWQLIINTTTTILTFLMVFIIQNTQNRDAVAIHLKLDELIRALRAARDKMINLEDLTDDELEKLQEEFKKHSRRTEAARRTPEAH